VDTSGLPALWRLLAALAIGVGSWHENRSGCAPRAFAARSPRVARASSIGKFAYAWSDNRSGRYEVYTRVP